MISFATFKWGSKYSAEHVNTLARMVARHYRSPHRMICVTNDAAGIDPSIEIVADREDFASVPSPHGGSMPSSYRRLRLFSPDIAETFGERIVNLDLDLVITADIQPLFERKESFIGWRDAYWPKQINGSVWMVKAGAHPEVWSDFEPVLSPRYALDRGYKGSDQGYISSMLPDCAKWTQADGVYSFKKDKCESLPANARIVVFHGEPKPWSERCQRIAWIRQHYR